MLHLSLVLPVQNQEEIIEGVFKKILKALNRLNISYECILVENGSKDQTLIKIRKLEKKTKNVKVVISPKGYGSAVLGGLSKAKGKFVCFMPSDGQVDLALLPKLWALSKSGDFKVVKIKRVTRESLSRLLQSRLFSFLMNLVHGVCLSDVNGSPKILLKKDLKLLKLKSLDTFIDAEIAIKAHKFGWKMKEVASTTLPRAGGKSTRSLATYFELIKGIIKYRFANQF